MDYGFTSKIEADFDKIADGQIDWTEHLRKTSTDKFHPTVESAKDIPKSESRRHARAGPRPQ